MTGLVEREITLTVGPSRAFAVWTEHVGLWWPKGHSMSQEDGARMAFEAGVGGRLVEHAPSGRELVWGRVLRWEPPTALSFSFVPGSPPGKESEVDVTFAALDDGGTRVRVVHRPAVLTDAEWEHSVAKFARGWEMLTAAYLRAFGE